MRDYDTWLKTPIQLPDWYFKDKICLWHNHICLLYSCDIVRLLGFAEGFDDFYYVVQNMGFNEKPYYASCVGHLESFKELLPKDTYDRMENVFNLNGCKPTEKFEVKKIPGNLWGENV